MNDLGPEPTKGLLTPERLVAGVDETLVPAAAADDPLTSPIVDGEQPVIPTPAA